MTPEDMLSRVDSVLADTPDPSLVFDRQCVREILRLSGISPHQAAGRLPEAATLSDFMAAYAFPVTVYAEKLKGTSPTAVGWSALFGSGFGRLPWICAFKEAMADDGTDPAVTPAAMLFNAPHAAGGTVMVVHNVPGTDRDWAPDDLAAADDSWTRIVRTDLRTRVTYVIEQLRPFLQRLGDDWLSS